MPHFYNYKEKYFISTNFKVMYSTLRRQEYLKKVKLFFLLFSNKDKYIIVREPYDRMESFFRDRLRKRLTNDNEWLRSQKIFFKPLQVKNKSTSEKFKALEKLNFEDFIKLVPVVYNKNRHLHPQNYIFKRILPKRILKLNNVADMEFLANNLNINVDIKANSTDQFKTDITWTKELIEIVNQIYHKDFELYGFEKK